MAHKDSTDGTKALKDDTESTARMIRIARQGWHRKHGKDGVKALKDSTKSLNDSTDGTQG
jgi:hypothetical protein